jgi:hypothetical protein
MKKKENGDKMVQKELIQLAIWADYYNQSCNYQCSGKAINWKDFFIFANNIIKNNYNF